jgi:benzoyl-CoA reductase subunit BamC
MFKDPDSGLPLKCDMCEGEERPLCVEWCLNDVLVYEERDEEIEEHPAMNAMEAGLESLIDQYGLEKISTAFARMSQKC